LSNLTCTDRGGPGRRIGRTWDQDEAKWAMSMEKQRLNVTSIVLGALFSLTVLAGCVGVAGDRVVVNRAGPEDLLKLRAGPGLGFKVIVGLPDGTELLRRDCVTEVGQLWCRVSLVSAPGLTGYVSADYLADR
jgi:hypothetical protein